MDKTVLFLLFLLSSFVVSAQKPQNNYTVQGWWGASADPFSPQLHEDSSITFRFKAKNANSVSLVFGEWDVKPLPMNKDTDGTWEIRIAPTAPGIYSYQFSVDGVVVIDPSNPVVKSGTEVYGSIVEVPGATQPRFDEVQQVPHGVLHHIKYNSSVLKRLRGMVVFLPAEYTQQTFKKFPVLY
ncbi:MAG: esterase, partial [Pedobacter sp.]